MKAISITKRWTLMSLLFLVLLFLALSVEGYSQVRTDRTPHIRKYADQNNVVLPERDTVIMRGEEVELGAFLAKRHDALRVEVINFGKSKEIKDDKMYIYTIKQKPKQTTTYTVRVWCRDNTANIWERTVYVAKDENEKKQLEKLARQREEEYKRALRNGTAHGMSVKSSKVK